MAKRKTEYEVLIGLNIVTDRETDPAGKRYEPGETITDDDIPGSAVALMRKGAIKPSDRFRGNEPEEPEEENAEGFE